MKLPAACGSHALARAMSTTVTRDDPEAASPEAHASCPDKRLAKTRSQTVDPKSKLLSFCSHALVSLNSFDRQSSPASCRPHRKFILEFLQLGTHAAWPGKVKTADSSYKACAHKTCRAFRSCGPRAMLQLGWPGCSFDVPLQPSSYCPANPRCCQQPSSLPKAKYFVTRWSSRWTNTNTSNLGCTPAIVPKDT